MNRPSMPCLRAVGSAISSGITIGTIHAALLGMAQPKTKPVSANRRKAITDGNLPLPCGHHAGSR